MVRRGGYSLPVDTENESLRCHILIGRENAEQTFLSGPSDTIPIPIPLHDIQQTKSVQYMSQDPLTKFQRHLHYPKRISRTKKKIKALHTTHGAKQNKDPGFRVQTASARFHHSKTSSQHDQIVYSQRYPMSASQVSPSRLQR